MQTNTINNATCFEKNSNYSFLDLLFDNILIGSSRDRKISEKYVYLLLFPHKELVS